MGLSPMNPTPKSLAILGCSGSIGAQTLDVVARFPDRLRVTALAAESRADAVAPAVRTHRPAVVTMMHEEAAARLRALCPDAEVRSGMGGLLAAATHPDVDTVVMSVKGAVGLLPTLAALEAGKTVALASKEVLVAAGELVMRTARAHNARVLPIDSEHSALFQCLNGEPENSVEELILTASGGPFRGWDARRLAGVTPREALAHPTWNMGPKITVDSATLMNKGLEVIEARWLFGVPAQRISVVIHPQSIIHSMARFTDGSVLAQMGLPDMRLPIQYALFYPERVANDLPRLDLAEIARLTFEEPDERCFPCLSLAYEAAARGRSVPAVLNAANEEAVALFLAGSLSFPGVATMVQSAMESHTERDLAGVEDVLEADAWARRFVRERAAGG